MTLLAPEYLIVAAVSAAAGLALGRVIRQRTRRFLFGWGAGAACLVAALASSASRDLVPEGLTVNGAGAALVGVAAVLLPFSAGALLTGP